MPRPRRRDITFYLVKEDVVDFDDILPPANGVTHWSSADAGLPFEGRLAVKAPNSKPPWWAGWLRPSFPGIGNLLNASNQAALLVTAPNGRLFVVTFSYGRNLMQLDAFERDFGLRVALNVVNPDSLRSVDARSCEQLTVMTRSQVSRAASLDSFRLSRAEDIMKGVTGTPRDLGFGTRISGADAANIHFVPLLDEIHDKCREVFSAYEGDGYKERFGFIDNLKTVRDPIRIAYLNSQVADRLSAGALGAMHLAPPEVTDIENIEFFVFDVDSEEVLEDLDLARYRETAVAAGRDLTPESLKRAKVAVTYLGNEALHWLWSVFDCLVAEVYDGGALFVLSGGTWYQVEPNYVTRVSEAVSLRARPPEFLPLRQGTETEPEYNLRASQVVGLHGLDGCLAKPSGATSPVEFCDLLRHDRRLVHVKRRSRSSTLSHLFAQGMISAELFLSDASFRSDLINKLTDRNQSSAARLIPVGRPVSTDWEVVFAVLADTEPAEALPFFSQLNFQLTAERLENMGFGVSLRQIPPA